MVGVLTPPTAPTERPARPRPPRRRVAPAPEGGRAKAHPRLPALPPGDPGGGRPKRRDTHPGGGPPWPWCVGADAEGLAAPGDPQAPDAPPPGLRARVVSLGAPPTDRARTPRKGPDAVRGENALTPRTPGRPRGHRPGAPPGPRQGPHPREGAAACGVQGGPPAGAGSGGAVALGGRWDALRRPPARAPPGAGGRPRGRGHGGRRPPGPGGRPRDAIPPSRAPAAHATGAPGRPPAPLGPPDGKDIAPGPRRAQARRPFPEGGPRGAEARGRMRPRRGGP